MMLSADNFSPYDVNKFEAEASDLGWKAGQWLNSFNVKGNGNGHDFVLIGACSSRDNELLYMKYRQVFGCNEIRIWND